MRLGFQPISRLVTAIVATTIVGGSCLFVAAALPFERVLVATAHAESNPFFDRDVAKTVFTDEAKVVVGGKVPESFKTGDVVKISNVAATDTAAAATNSSEKIEKALPADARSKIIAQYGDPSQPTPLKAVDDAPMPFKGLIVALDAGDEQLAQQYANQWADYMRRLKASNSRAVNLMLDTERKVNAHAQSEVAAAAQQEFGTADIAAVAAKFGSMNAEEKSTHTAAIGSVGHTKIFFFFESGSPASGVAAREIDAFMQQSGQRMNVSAMAVNADFLGAPAALEFKQRYGLSIPVMASRELAASLGVTEMPTVAILPAGATKATLKSGGITAAELKKIISEVGSI